MKPTKKIKITLAEYCQLVTGKTIDQATMKDMPSAGVTFWKANPGLSKANGKLLRYLEKRITAEAEAEGYPRLCKADRQLRDETTAVIRKSKRAREYFRAFAGEAGLQWTRQISKAFTFPHRAAAIDFAAAGFPGSVESFKKAIITTVMNEVRSARKSVKK